MNDIWEDIDTLKDSINDLVFERNQLEERVKKQQEVIEKVTTLIKKYGKYDGERCTRGFQMWVADFNKILDILKEASK